MEKQNSNNGKRYHTFQSEMNCVFGSRVLKIALDGGFTCPNRDGTKGNGGCIYCSEQGAGEFAGKRITPLAVQLESGKALLSGKWNASRYIAYFQAYSNTYAPLEQLRERYEEALALPGVVGLSISTRPDLLPDDVLDYLSDLNRRTYLEVELGLQSSHDTTLRRINRCHTYADFLEGYRKLNERGIRVCVHLINSLPGETAEMMRETARRVARLQPNSVKIHMLYILKNSRLEKEYQAQTMPLLSMEQYISLVCDQLELLPPDTVIQRLTGDGDRSQVVAPEWTLHKRRVRNGIDAELRRRSSRQGMRWAEQQTRRSDND